MKKICFVIMGFGKKMDYENNKEVDLDIIYNKVVKKLFSEDFLEYKLIRADEIVGSSLIDTSMYALLLNADLVIADLTTLNPNAIYELGVRHAVKPFSTIIMAQKSCSIPFDLGHSRFLRYEDFGEKLDEDEAKAIINELRKYVFESKKNTIDSPLYSYLPDTAPPVVSKELYLSIVEDAESRNDTISKKLNAARDNMNQSKFVEASVVWEELSGLLPNNEYVCQQWALATYKSEYPNETKSLENALDIIKKLNPSNTLDHETLGINGAIYKRLFKLNGNFDYLEEAIESYKKGYIITSDYYNGENYATCSMLKCKKPGLSEDEVNYLLFESKSVYKKVIEQINHLIQKGDANYWAYATLAVSNYVLGNRSEYERNLEIFVRNCEAEWQQETLLETIADIDRVLLVQGGL